MSFDIPGLNIRLRPISHLRQPDKNKYFQEMMSSNCNYLKSATFTDMAFFLPQDQQFINVSEQWIFLKLSIYCR